MVSERIMGIKSLFSVRTKILLVFLALSFSALLLTGYLAFTQIGELSHYALESNKNLGNRASEDSAAALTEDSKKQLLRLAKDQAYISNIIFERVGSETTMMAQYASEIVSDPSLVRERRLFLQNDKPDNPFSTSVLFMAPGVENNISPNEKNAASMLDSIFIPVLQTDSDVEAVYVGTASGMSFIYPWTSGLNETFDPRLRSWFIEAIRSGNLTWSDPYIDLLGNGLMVTCSKSVLNQKNNWTWVIGSDVTIETINQNIIGTQIGNTGYAMLIDKNGDVITRPGLTAGDKRWDESFITENLLKSNNSALVKTVQDIVTGNTGVKRVSFEDGDRFIAYAPVGSVNWSVVLVMPVQEIIAPAVKSKMRILQVSEDTASHFTQQQEMMKSFFAISFIILLGIVCLLTYAFSRILTRPLLELQKGSQAIGQGNLDYRVNITSRDEFGDLALSFNTMAADLKEYIRILRKTTAEQERLVRELEIAKGIQQSFLPESAPELKGFDLKGYNIPATEVGGDFYDFISLGDKKWGLVIADVAGKGVPAALFMALSRTLIRASATGIFNPATSIIDANRHICLDSKASMFVTLFYAILDTDMSTLTFVNAGHNPPFIINKDSGDVTLLKAEGIALGVIDEISLESIEIKLDPGDMVVLYTDGVTESTDKQNEEYGTERLTSLAQKLKELSAQEVIDKIVNDVIEFSTGKPQFDDITIIVLKVTD